MSRRCVVRSDRRYVRIDAKKNTPASTFLRSLIHATDSTLIGCSAKIAAAIHAPGTASSAEAVPATASPSATTSASPLIDCSLLRAGEDAVVPTRLPT